MGDGGGVGRRRLSMSDSFRKAPIDPKNLIKSYKVGIEGIICSIEVPRWRKKEFSFYIMLRYRIGI